MKKATAAMLVLILVMGTLTACGSKDKGGEETKGKGDGTYEIALVTDVGNIDDQSFNQGAWEGIAEYAKRQNISYNYYRPSEDSGEARIETMKNAIKKGAKVIVCPGYLFEPDVYIIQKEFPQTQFLLLDGEPKDAASNVEIASNVHCIKYREEQAGYLAGYAAVKEGYQNLGFLGGMEVPAVQKYGHGFIQGAEAAAKEAGVKVKMNYWYSGSFLPTDDIMNKVSGWYTEGTKVVFACGGAIYLSATQAAEAAGGKVIGVDVDQSGMSGTVITSAMKELKTSVVTALGQLYDHGGTWPADLAGATSILGADADGVGLAVGEGSWRLEKFTVEEYRNLYEAVKRGDIAVLSDVETPPKTTEVKVDYQN